MFSTDIRFVRRVYALVASSEDAKLMSRARELDIDLDKHRCDCDSCSRASNWCPAARSSLAEEIAQRSQ